MRILLVALLALSLAACRRDAARDAADAPKPAASLTPEQLDAVLATADAADGTVDHVVSKCAGCRLGMDGRADHAVSAHGYQLHFCSDDCKARSSKDIDATITACK